MDHIQKLAVLPCGEQPDRVPPFVIAVTSVEYERPEFGPMRVTLSGVVLACGASEVADMAGVERPGFSETLQAVKRKQEAQRLKAEEAAAEAKRKADEEARKPKRRILRL